MADVKWGGCKYIFLEKDKCQVEDNECILGMLTWKSLGEIQVETCSKHWTYGSRKHMGIKLGKWVQSGTRDSAALMGESPPPHPQPPSG